MKKKILTVLLIGIMVFALTSCDLQLLGKWKIIEVAAGDVVMDQNDISDMGIDVGYIKLNRSGSCELNLLGDEFDGTWSASGEGANSSNTLTINYGADSTASAKFDESGNMIFTDSQGAVYTLNK